MKKGFLFVISLCFIFTICFSTIITSAETLTINEMKEILISKSFSETFLNLSSDESIETLYQNYNNAESLGSSTSTAYLNEQISDGPKKGAERAPFSSHIQRAPHRADAASAAEPT